LATDLVALDTCTDPTIAAGGAVGAANEIARSSGDTARELYLAILNSPTSTPTEKRCAAVGIGELVPDASEPTGIPAVLAGIQEGWNEFFARVVEPAWALIVPFLAALGVLVVLSRLLARFTVGPDTRGARDRGRWTRTVSFLVHWLCGVGSLLLAAFLLTVGMALVAKQTQLAELTTLISVWSIVLVLGAVGMIVALGTGRAREIGWPFYVLLAIVICGAPWALGRVTETAAAAYIVGVAVAFAALGLWTVARGNGLQIGMLIEGRNADGTADTSAAQRVQAQLYAMTSTQPGQAGIMLPRDTDASIPDSALELVPEGTAAKAIKAVASALWPKSSWRISVDAVGNGRVQVTIFRNSRYVDAATIHRDDFMSSARTGLSTPAGSGSLKVDVGADATVPAQVWVGVSAFILVTLARRYQYVDTGICRVRDWRSIAAQCVAADDALSGSDTSRLLLAAVAFDGNNLGAELARINDQHGKAAEGDQVIEQLNSLMCRLTEAKLHDGPMGLRLRFNLAVAHANRALKRNPKSGEVVGTADAGRVVADWQASAEQIEEVLRALFGKSGAYFGRFGPPLPAPPTDLGGFYDTLRGPAFGVGYLVAKSKVPPGEGLNWSPEKRFKNILKLSTMDLPTFESTSSKLVPTTLARYEKACVYAYMGQYPKVTEQLTPIAGSETIRSWAREDPSLDRWWASDEAGMPCLALLDDPTSGIVDVKPFAGYRDQLAARGVATAQELRRRASLLAAELSLGSLEGDYWRRIAGFQLSLSGAGQLDRKCDAMLLSRLLALGIDSETKLVAEIRRNPDTTAGAAPEASEDEQGRSIAVRLAPRQTGYAWSAPTAVDFRTWARNRR